MDRMIRTVPEEHTHRVAGTRQAPSWLGPVAERHSQNPKAWGGVRWRQRCRCGAVRDIVVNGVHDELGPWVLHAPAQEASAGTAVPIRRRVAS